MGRMARKTLAMYLVVISVAGFLALQQNNTHSLASPVKQMPESPQTKAPETPKTVTNSEPIRIIIPKIGIDIDVVRSTYDDKQQTWPVSAVAANYATNTPLISNKSGKSLIFGHARKNVFADIGNLTASDSIYIKTASGNTLEYVYANSTIVSPTDVEIFDNLTGKPGVFLMTCDGVWSQNRRLMQFELKEVI
jgi:LPXTG-site transpeptidase (sortase) family protein